MIHAAAISGATTAKFQFWDPKYLKQGSWDEDGRRQIYDKAALNIDDIHKLSEITTSNNINFLISVFGTIGAKIIKDLEIESIKIPSHETTNIELIKFCANNFKYIYFSAGASLETEVMNALDILKKGSAKFNLMHCVSSYPCVSNAANLPRINWLSSLCDKIGYSDHTGSTVIPAGAVAQGCTVIEKHFTTNKNLPGRDNKFALDPNEFEEMCSNIRDVEAAMNDKGLDFQPTEKDTVHNYRGRWEPHDYQS